MNEACSEESILTEDFTQFIKNEPNEEIQLPIILNVVGNISQDHGTNSENLSDYTNIKLEISEEEQIEELDGNFKEEIEYDDRVVVKEEVHNFYDDNEYNEDYDHKKINEASEYTEETSIKSEFDIKPEVVKIHQVVSENLYEIELVKSENETITSEILDDHIKKEPNDSVNDGGLLQPLGLNCSVCFRTFKYIKAYNKHKQLHEENESIKLDNLKSDKEAENNDDLTKLSMFYCKCGKSFKRLSSVTSCLRAHNINGIPCDLCSLVFFQRIDLNRHVKSVHEDLKEGYKCNVCSQLYSDRKKYNEHVQAHLLYNITLGNKTFRSQGKGAVLKKVVTCTDCGLKFRGEEILQYHIELEHRLDNLTRNKKLKRLTKPKTEKVHLKPDHVEIKPDLDEHDTSGGNTDAKKIKPTLNQSVQFKYTCKKCGMKIETLGELKKHKTEHHSVKFECDRCKDKFDSRSEYTSHRTWHCRGGQYLPGQCSYVITPPRTAKQKVRKKKREKAQMKTVSYACDICSETFKSKYFMLRHKSSHPFVVFVKDDSTKRQIFFK